MTASLASALGFGSTHTQRFSTWIATSLPSSLRRSCGSRLTEGCGPSRANTARKWRSERRAYRFRRNGIPAVQAGPMCHNWRQDRAIVVT